MMAVDAYFKRMAERPRRAARDAERIRKLGSDADISVSAQHEPLHTKRVYLTNEVPELTLEQACKYVGEERSKP